MDTRNIIITGASSGFGKACAEILAKENHHLILCARREDRLKELASVLSHKCAVSTYCFDVQSEEETKKAAISIGKTHGDIHVLINNAGLALGKSNLKDGDTSDWNQMIDTNVKGLLWMTKYCYPFLDKTGNGSIINIGSIAGKEVYPGGNVYCASKHAVDAITKAMRQDFLADRIRVSQIAPGAAETEFSLVRFKGDAEKAKNVYNGYKALQAEDIAKCAEFILSLPPHVCINDMVVMPAQQANSTTFNTYE